VSFHAVVISFNCRCECVLLKTVKNRLRQGASYIQRDKPALLTFLFHSVFRSEQEILLNHIDPQQHITLDIYRYFLEYFLEAGYQFVSPDDLASGLDPSGRYILSTFDDGYYNNQHVLPLLAEYDAPALFFITTRNVLDGQCFWWDVLYRELNLRGASRKEISAAQKDYKKLSPVQIVSRLKDEFGRKVMNPSSDLDRPFTPSELKSFAGEKYVYIGNHTSRHYLLDHCSDEVQREQMIACQREIQCLLDLEPTIISYPNGNYNRRTLQLARELGFTYGVTVDKRKNYLPLRDDDRLVLGRYVLWGTRPVGMQCDIFRSDMTLPSRKKV